MALQHAHGTKFFAGQTYCVLHQKSNPHLSSFSRFLIHRTMEVDKLCAVFIYLLIYLCFYSTFSISLLLSLIIIFYSQKDNNYHIYKNQLYIVKIK